ncbi:hypothetical protein EJB05_08940, partial [Eragrostis curvula]
MALLEGPIETTASWCAPAKARGRHTFEVTGYSQHKGLGVSHYIDSTPFTVGGYEWCITYFPDGDEHHEDYASVFLFLSSEITKQVRILYNLKLLNPATGVWSSVRTENCVMSNEVPITGTAGFIKRSELEASYVRDDRFVIQCDLTVFGTPVSRSRKVCEIQVPPSDVLDNLGKLLEFTEGADVTIKVRDEVFHAHKIVLAMRSPVFKAELYGPMSDKSVKDVTLNIEDMQPAVFRVLLHFIYNDSLPAMDDLDGYESEEMVKHLLEAADRYAMERMKVICESILSKKLDVESVAATLALADQHHCSQLKDACIEFIHSSNRLDDVVESQGYAHLKRACPSVIIEIWERSAKSLKVQDIELMPGI